VVPWQGVRLQFGSSTIDRFEPCDVLLIEQATMVAIGPRPASVSATHMSAFAGKADMGFCTAEVRLTQSGHVRREDRRDGAGQGNRGPRIEFGPR
jgi:hypothetical protein